MVSEVSGLSSWQPILVKINNLILFGSIAFISMNLFWLWVAKTSFILIYDLRLMIFDCWFGIWDLGFGFWNFYDLVFSVSKRAIISSEALIVFFNHCISISNFSASESCQFTFVCFIFETTLCKIIAAETEIFKLSVKPYIGIFKNPSAAFITVSLSPSLSFPKKNALF